ncbi:sulfite exporter TauE/SafE family protein [Oceanospirillum maris]|uniref:sulfite exporter TauE/SafE family protein n=1 Tax=Oceanospirillum maris TaxID=64977 RepID=UPI0003FC5472|nr:sulfite exporter TauE/SafE family protein [Oceanospirillum maris]
MDTATVLALAAVTLGIGIQAWTGIGFGLLSAPLLYLISPAYVPGPVLVLGFVLSLMVVVRHRNGLICLRVLTASIARIPGAWLGASLLGILPVHWLGITLGLALLFALVITRYRFSLAPDRWTLILAGFSSGVMGTATSVGGPPMAMVYQKTERLQSRNELALFFMLTTPVSLLMLAFNDLFDFQTLLLTLPLLPGVVAGYAMGGFLARYLNPRQAKSAMFLLSVIGAVVVLLTGVRELL